MKKSLYLLLAIGLVVSTAFMAGCGKKDNPFEPITDSYNASQAVESQGPTVLSMNTRDLNNTLYEAPTYDEIVILFDADMNASTINTSTILLQNVENLSAALAYTVTYDAGSKKAVIKATTGWNDDLSYLVTVTTGVKDIHGNALDGNGNDWVDPQDFYREQFWGFTSTVANYDMTPPQATITNPTNNTFWFSLTDSIRVTITDNDSVDLTSITPDAFELTTAGGQKVTLPAIYIDESAAPATYTVRFRPLSTVLKDSNDYFLTVKTTIKDMKGNRLDGNSNGDAENEFMDRKRVKFRTYDPRNGGGVPNFYGNLRVFEAKYVDNNRGLEIRFTHKMNPATLTSANIKIYNNSDYTGFIPGTITLLPDTMGVRYDLANYDGSGYLWVSRLVRDTAGFYLDQNNNGIPGEAAYTTGPSAYQAGDDMFGAISYTTSLAMVLFQDNAEGSNAGWVLRGTTPQLWHHSTRRLWAGGGYSGKFAWHCGVDADSSYLVTGPTAVHDTLMMPEMDLTAYNIYGHAYIYYTYWFRTDGGADALRLIASTDNGASWATIATQSGNSGGWDQVSQNVTGYLGTKVRFALAFDTDNVGNVYPSEGFYFDNYLLYVY